MKFSVLIALLLMILRLAAPVAAQTATATYDIPAAVAPAPPITLAQAQGWSGVLYVNSMPFPSPHTCTLVVAVIRCTFTIANIGGALTGVGQQVFAVALNLGPILGEGNRSLPFTLTKPGAPINFLLQ